MTGVCTSCEQVENIVNETWGTCESCEAEYNEMADYYDRCEQEALSSDE